LIVDADRQYDYAKSRLDSGAHDEAVTEFNRFIHFFPTDGRVQWARFFIGDAHFKAGRYPDAAAVFGALTAEASEAGLQKEAFFMLSRSHARQGMVDQAMVDLHNLMAVSSQTEVIDQARYELGWLQVDVGQWSLARQAFDQIQAENRQRYRLDDLTSALDRHPTIPQKSPFTAGMLSIIPGGGQLYCGRYQDALTAFLINAGLILSAWEAFDNELYALGGVISFVEFGFYSGNIYGAVSSAHKFNRDRADAFRRDLYWHRQPRLSMSVGETGAALCLRVDF
jgi:tetratricopeptide (TPR) repeat protein